ncbi:TolC family protein [bacterium]|nr:TolC family protein [bacterium]
MRRSFLVCCLLVVLGSAGGPAIALEGELSLREAIAHARSFSPTLKAGKLLIAQTEASQRGAEAERWPRLLLSSALSQTGKDTGVAFAQGAWDTKLSLNQRLFDAFLAQDAQQQTALARRRAEAEFEAADLALQYEVARTYFDVLRAQALEAASRVDIQQAKAQLEVAKMRLKGGVSTELDVLQVQALVASAEDRRLQAQATLDAAQLAFATLLGQSGTSIHPDAKAVLLPLEMPPASASSALTQRPELRALDVGRQLQELVVRQRSRAKLPTLEAAGNLGASPYGGASYGVTGTLSWTLLDSGRIGAQVQQAEQDAARAAAILDAGRLSATLDIQRAQAALHAFQGRTQLTQQQLAAANRALQLARMRFERGVGTNLEMIQALTALNQAQSAAIAAKFDGFAAQLKLAQALALPVEALSP